MFVRGIVANGDIIDDMESEEANDAITQNEMLQYCQIATKHCQFQTFCDLFWRWWNRSRFSPKSVSFFGFFLAFPADRNQTKSPAIF